MDASFPFDIPLHLVAGITFVPSDGIAFLLIFLCFVSSSPTKRGAGGKRKVTATMHPFGASHCEQRERLGSCGSRFLTIFTYRWIVFAGFWVLHLRFASRRPITLRDNEHYRTYVLTCLCNISANAFDTKMNESLQCDWITALV